MITISDFQNIEMRVGMVNESTAVEGSVKLIRLVVDFSDEQRIIFTGVRKWYEPDYFVKKKFLFVTNLEPKRMPSFAPDGASEGKDEESQGMILATDSPNGPIFLEPGENSVTGAKIR